MLFSAMLVRWLLSGSRASWNKWKQRIKCSAMWLRWFALKRSPQLGILFGCRVEVLKLSCFSSCVGVYQVQWENRWLTVLQLQTCQILHSSLAIKLSTSLQTRSNFILTCLLQSQSLTVQLFNRSIVSKSLIFLLLTLLDKLSVYSKNWRWLGHRLSQWIYCFGCASSQGSSLVSYLWLDYYSLTQ